MRIWRDARSRLGIAGFANHYLEFWRSGLKIKTSFDSFISLSILRECGGVSTSRDVEPPDMYMGSQTDAGRDELSSTIMLSIALVENSFCHSALVANFQTSLANALYCSAFEELPHRPIPHRLQKNEASTEGRRLVVFSIQRAAPAWRIRRAMRRASSSIGIRSYFCHG